MRALIMRLGGFQVLAARRENGRYSASGREMEEQGEVVDAGWPAFIRRGTFADSVLFGKLKILTSTGKESGLFAEFISWFGCYHQHLSNTSILLH